ncbi:MAG: hypothetical protein R2724_24515 [Bryobacterales bacterium]
MASAEERLDELEEEDLAFQFIGSGGFDELDILDVQGFYEEAFHALPAHQRRRRYAATSLDGLNHSGRL